MGRGGKEGERSGGGGGKVGDVMTPNQIINNVIKPSPNYRIHTLFSGHDVWVD